MSVEDQANEKSTNTENQNNGEIKGEKPYFSTPKVFSVAQNEDVYVSQLLKAKDEEPLSPSKGVFYKEVSPVQISLSEAPLFPVSKEEEPLSPVQGTVAQPVKGISGKISVKKVSLVQNDPSLAPVSVGNKIDKKIQKKGLYLASSLSVSNTNASTTIQNKDVSQEKEELLTVDSISDENELSPTPVSVRGQTDEEWTEEELHSASSPVSTEEQTINQSALSPSNAGKEQPSLPSNNSVQEMPTPLSKVTEEQTTNQSSPLPINARKKQPSLPSNDSILGTITPPPFQSN